MASATAGHAETLTLGSVNDNIRKHIERFTPLAQYLERELADAGITAVEISVLPDSEAMAEALRQGDVDLYFDSPLVATRVAQMADAVPFLRRWKNGEATYHSVIVVPADSDMQTIDDLRGSVIGFQEPDSTSGYLLPLAMLLDADLLLQHLHQDHEQPAEHAVGYLFTGDDRNTALGLVRGTLDAGATDNQGFESLQTAQPDRFRALARSIEVPRQVVVRSGALDETLASVIADTLRSMEESAEGVQVMASFHDTTHFDDFPDGVEATFAPIQSILAQISSGSSM
ncbi:MAG: phosphate/phosphite/phosphonate ABC transporter substrate-binding protein [Rhizobiales bacterium]|nr:phosphate/phosphite/phosphonate ABC transporter substrate-binding protein [Hyphomicrobiales bacterium]MBO6699750.1 phosphate/phosphite/phosphonate ABC transporter substrate-binding protein [Hyphomicrobiales bacterium]MBO6737288.1 phosphate/phosphite/phosphonate ABC transporter substrate-binding protein [Hyphomicrobiales bacterium]MBO6911638.1 phosphate/phosphite/phosphonate ABC transporter substrate-binding protein [Hyphomicrobiales bacterium]MBO6954940.1 phosphate/phosphite/phosphonate ABC 